MEKQIGRMHAQDRGLIIAFIIFLWIVLIYAMIEVTSLAPDPGVQLLILTAGSVAGIAATSALIAVLVHLKDKRNLIYAEEIRYSCSQSEG